MRNLRPGSQPSGSSMGTIKKYEKIWELDTSHFDPHWASRRSRPGGSKKRPLDEILCINTHYASSLLKTRLIQSEILKEECLTPCCPTKEMVDWCGKKITYHLDHINGVHSDNRIDNLRILCIMCHSQTDTYGSRRQKVIHHCPDCGKSICKKSKRCQRCASFSLASYKIEWPPTESLIKESEASSVSAVARRLGVTPNAVKKRIKNHPPK